MCALLQTNKQTKANTTSDDNARMLVHALISSRVDYCNSNLHCIAAVHLRPFQSVLKPLHGWLLESGSSTTLRRVCVTTFTAFLLTSESSSNYVCSCSNVNTRWHHHTWHRCASSCRPTHAVVSYDQWLVMIFWSHAPGLLAMVHVTDLRIGNFRWNRISNQIGGYNSHLNQISNRIGG